MFSYFEWLLVAFPLLGALANGLLGQRFPRRTQTAVAYGTVLCALLTLLPLLAGQAMAPGLVGRPPSLPWIRVWAGEQYIEGAVALRIDALSALTALAVLLVGLCIHLYVANKSVQVDSHLALAALNAILTACMVLVLADNMPTLFLGWALAGWSSVWLTQCLAPLRPPEPPGRKSARSGDSEEHGRSRSRLSMPLFQLASDILLLTAIGLMSASFISLDLQDITALRLQSAAEGSQSASLSGAVVCLIASAAIRAGQFPFQLWLVERAPAGEQAVPWNAATAVYALTSVPAGVYLLARLLPVVSEVAFGPLLLAWYGAGAALLMALAGWLQPDRHRAIRYVAVSQGGAMFAALGVGAQAAALCYLLAYVLLQTLIFLASSDAAWVSGSRTPASAKTHGYVVNNQASGTAVALGLAAATGIPTLPGFAFARRLLHEAFFASKGVWVLATITILLTAAAAARAAMVFVGQQRPSGPGTPTASNTAVLSALAFFAIVVGLLGLFSPSPLERFLAPALSGAETAQLGYIPPAWWAFLVPPVLTIAGVALARWLPGRAEEPVDRFRAWIAGGYGLPSFFRAFVAQPILAAGHIVAQRIEPSAARWMVDPVAKLLDGSDRETRDAPAKKTERPAGPALLPYILGTIAVLTFLLMAYFARTR